jgi:DNA-binding transcriptional LysR family regulator
VIDDIRYLIVFAKVAQAGSLSRAAEAMGLSVATVSGHVAKLEANLGTALLYRNTRKLSLTADGEKLLETARSMLSLYENGVIEFRQRAVSTAERIRVALPAILLGCQPFMDAFGLFCRAHTGLQADIHCSDQRADLIEEGIDVAFRIGQLEDSTLKAKPLFSFERMLVAAPALAAAGQASDPDQLASLPWIGLSMLPNRRVFFAADGSRCEVRYLPRVQVDSVDAALALALQGLGLAAPPAFLAGPEVAAGRLVQVLPEWTLEPMTVHAVWPSNMQGSSAAYALINAIHQAFANAPAIR